MNSCFRKGENMFVSSSLKAEILVMQNGEGIIAGRFKNRFRRRFGI